MSAIDDFDGNNFSAGPGVGALHFPETFDDVERWFATQPSRLWQKWQLLLGVGLACCLTKGHPRP
jgi:hypothetical protein